MKSLWLFASSVQSVSGEVSQTPLEEFEHYYYETRPLVAKAIFSITRDTNSDDLVQETYAKAWEKFKSFRGDSKFSSWIYRIAINTALEFVRKNSKNLKQLSSQTNEINLIASEELGPGQKILLSDLLKKSFLKMKAKHLEVFLLFYQMEYSIQEISGILNLSEGTVKSRLHYAKKAFSEQMKSLGVNNGR